MRVISSLKQLPGDVTPVAKSGSALVITVNKMNNWKVRWSAILLLMALVAGLMSYNAEAEKPSLDPNAVFIGSCTVAGQNGQDVRYVINPGKKTGQDDAVHVTMTQGMWNELQSLKTTNREMYDAIVDSLCSEAATATETPTAVYTATSTALAPEATATVTPTVIPPFEDNNKNKDCTWVVNDKQPNGGHYECGGVPAVPHPSATPTAIVIVNTPIPGATLEATAIPDATEVPATEETEVVITDGDQIPGGSEDSTAAEEGKKQYVCREDDHGKVHCNWEPVK